MGEFRGDGLVTADPARYGRSMFARIATVALLAGLGLNTASAETVVLKEKSSVTGKILAQEKRDVVIVDLGYTVLTIPRSQIARIAKEEEEKTCQAAQGQTAFHGGDGTGDGTEGERFRPVPGFKRHRAGKVRPRIGRTIGRIGGASQDHIGLGSGFFLNEEGYLIDFHVIEGETQISIGTISRTASWSGRSTSRSASSR